MARTLERIVREGIKFARSRNARGEMSSVFRLDASTDVHASVVWGVRKKAVILTLVSGSRVTGCVVGKIHARRAKLVVVDAPCPAPPGVPDTPKTVRRAWLAALSAYNKTPQAASSARSAR